MLSTTSSIDSYKMASEEKQLFKLMRNPRFQEAVCVIERLLANNCFNEEQKRFRGLTDPDIFREDIQYQYSLKLLWTFANNATKGMSCVNKLVVIIKCCLKKFRSLCRRNGMEPGQQRFARRRIWQILLFRNR